MQLRFATHGAAAGWAEVQMSASPFRVSSEESVLHDMTHHPGTLARYVVIEHGKVLGLTRVRAHRPGEVRALVQVHADHQGRGVGRLLLDQVLRVADGRDVVGVVNGDERSIAVADHWGFVREREHRISSVDPHDVPLPRPAPAGVALVALSDVTAEQVWECHQATAVDDLSGMTRPMPFDEYVATQWSDPQHRADLGRAALDGDQVVAFALVEAAAGRAWDAMTGTRPSHRGRGLATLVKAHSLAAMADAGITKCSTGHDNENAAMLAVNDRLGFTPLTSVWSARLGHGTTEGRRGIVR